MKVKSRSVSADYDPLDRKITVSESTVFEHEIVPISRGRLLELRRRIEEGKTPEKSGQVKFAFPSGAMMYLVDEKDDIFAYDGFSDLIPTSWKSVALRMIKSMGSC